MKVWIMRMFATTLARSRIQAQNQRNKLGFVWLILTPLLDAAVYGTVFGILQGGKRPDHFIQFLVIGIFFFRFFSACISKGATAIIGNRSLVQSLSFPRMVLPLATLLEELFNFLPMLVVLLLITLGMGVMPSWRWLLLVPVVGLAALFGMAVVLFCARVAVHFRDVTQLVPFTNRLMRYFSGVFYSPATFVGGFPIIMALFSFNPVYDYMEMARYALIPGYEVGADIIWSGLGWAVLGVVAAAVFFWRAEERYGRVD